MTAEHVGRYPGPVSQSRAVRSMPALATVRPDGANAAAVTRAACFIRPIRSSGRQREDASSGLAGDHDHRPPVAARHDLLDTSPGTPSSTGGRTGAPVSASSVRSEPRAITSTVRSPAPNTAADPSTRLTRVDARFRGRSFGLRCPRRQPSREHRSDSRRARQGADRGRRSLSHATRRATGAEHPPHGTSGRPPRPRARTPARAPGRSRAARARSRPAARPSRHAPARARRSVARTRRRRARTRARDQRAPRRRGNRADDAVVAPRREHAQPPVPRRDGSSSRARRPRGRRGRSPTDRLSSVRRMRWFASVATTD